MGGYKTNILFLPSPNSSSRVFGIIPTVNVICPPLQVKRSGLSGQFQLENPSSIVCELGVYKEAILVIKERVTR